MLRHLGIELEETTASYPPRTVGHPFGNSQDGRARLGGIPEATGADRGDREGGSDCSAQAQAAKRVGEPAGES